MSWGVSSRNVSHEDYDCVLRLPDLVRKCTWHTGVRHSVPSCSAFNGTDGDFRPSSTSVAKCVDCAGVEPGDAARARRREARHAGKAAAAARGRRLLETPTVPLSVFTITKRCRVACNGARCAYDETSMHKAGKEAKGERKMLG